MINILNPPMSKIYQKILNIVFLLFNFFILNKYVLFLSLAIPINFPLLEIRILNILILPLH